MDYFFLLIKSVEYLNFSLRPIGAYAPVGHFSAL
jgi:hypothetical protein